MIDIQTSWVHCELIIDEGYARNSKLIFYHGQAVQEEFEFEIQEAVNTLIFLQKNGFEVTNHNEIFYGEVNIYYLSRTT